MATIRATCPDCGDVEFTTRDVEVNVRQDGTGSYAFRCPGCTLLVVKPAEARTIELLVASGVRSATGDVPAEVIERSGGGDPITHDDLLDFHDLLHRDDSWQATLSTDGNATS
jgi:uncharacterized Zn finger protein